MKPLVTGEHEHEYQKREKVIKVDFFAEISDNQDSDALKKNHFLP